MCDRGSDRLLCSRRDGPSAERLTTIGGSMVRALAGLLGRSLSLLLGLKPKSINDPSLTISFSIMA